MIKQTLIVLAGLMATTNSWAAQGQGPTASDSAQQGHRGKGRGHGKGQGRGLMKDLNLSAEQRQKIKEIRESSRSKNQSLKESMKTQREALKSALKDSNSSNAQLKSLFEAIQGTRKTLAASRFESMLAVREILTPEQRALMAEKREAFGEHGGDEKDDN
jgi:periplasmic protein CpxP/Spy